VFGRSQCEHSLSSMGFLMLASRKLVKLHLNPSYRSGSPSVLSACRSHSSGLSGSPATGAGGLSVSATPFSRAPHAYQATEGV
jgi:hypothetical protein